MWAVSCVKKDGLKFQGPCSPGSYAPGMEVLNAADAAGRGGSDGPGGWLLAGRGRRRARKAVQGRTVGCSLRGKPRQPLAGTISNQKPNNPDELPIVWRPSRAPAATNRAWGPGWAGH